jgi:hypothetical protein
MTHRVHGVFAEVLQQRERITDEAIDSLGVHLLWTGAL